MGKKKTEKKSGTLLVKALRGTKAKNNGGFLSFFRSETDTPF